MSRRRRYPRTVSTKETTCLMPKCRRKTSRPFGYCDKCWTGARRAES